MAARDLGNKLTQAETLISARVESLLMLNVKVLSAFPWKILELEGGSSVHSRMQFFDK